MGRAGWVWLLVWAAAVLPWAALATGALAAPQRLAAGKEEGTFRFACDGELWFTAAPMYPVSIALARVPPAFVAVSLPGIDVEEALALEENLTAKRTDAAKVMVIRPKPFRLEADLRPGVYVLEARMATDAGRRAYNDAPGPTLYVNPSGVAVLSNDSALKRPTMLTHVQKIVANEPKPYQALDDKRPVLKWKAVARATSYTVQWLVLNPKDRTVLASGKPAKVTKPEYSFAQDVSPGRLYEWSVRARDVEGNEIGHLPAAFFVTAPTQLKDVAKTSASNSGWLGAVVRPVTPEDERENPDAEAGRGLMVGKVIPGSPAAAAGLQANDVVVSIDSVSADNVAAFLHRVFSFRPGQRATLTVRRSGKEQKLPLKFQSTLRKTLDEPAPDPVPEDNTHAGN